MSPRLWFTVGTGTLTAGALAIVLFPSNQTVAAVAASTLGALGSTVLTRTDQEDTRKILSKLSELEAAYRQLDRQLAGVLTAPPSPRNPARPPIHPAANAPCPQTFTPLPLAPADPPPDRPSAIADWFQNRNIAFREARGTRPEDAVLAEVAFLLGRDYRFLDKFYKQIKRAAIDEQRRFGFVLAGIPAEEVRAIKGFCWALRENPFWQSRYVQEPNRERMEVMPIANPHLGNFLEGGWLELFVYQQVCCFLTDKGLAYVGMRGVKITLPQADPNGQQNFELDMFFLVEGKPLWLECKVGANYKDDVPKYTGQRKLMGLPKAFSVLVLTDISREQSEGFTRMGEITIASVDNFLAWLDRALSDVSELEETVSGQPFLAAPPPAPVREAPRPPLVLKGEERNRILELLNKKSLHPCLEIRPQVWQRLIELFRAPVGEIGLNELKERLAEDLQISKGKINGLMRALKFAGCFLDANGEPIPSYGTPISALLSLDAEVLEQKCREVYAMAVLQENPQCFDDPRNQRKFQEATGQAVPDPETLQRLRHTIASRLDASESTAGDDGLVF